MKRLRLQVIGLVLLSFLTVVPADADVVSIDELVFTEVEGGYEVASKTRVLRGAVVIPAEYNGKPVIGIAKNGFKNSISRFQSVTMPETIIYIGDSAFYSCSGIENLNIPASVRTIGKYAFCGCRNITSLDIPSGVTKIEDGVFYDCRGLTEINIPSGVTSIGEAAFIYCKSAISSSAKSKSFLYQ
ncbi:leucine-rich repeat domain-containing protein [Xylanibacter muris]|uniref:Leucine-rich repeat domain-containing protein n=3 Tax=Xylanibacter muris TaxID=2736290 RepID=A0ABX2AMV3_9BACT|nr:leucine-rich repeat domain-containing protein [Xylanibacter muris]NPD92523.1 leucine-rich repeat domain-containing protein [Xylanibacter muris]